MSRRDELIAARERAGMSRAALAGLIGVNRSHVHHVETGVRNPSIALMRRWAVALKASSPIWTAEDVERVSLHESRWARALSPRRGARHDPGGAAISSALSAAVMATPRPAFKRPLSSGSAGARRRPWCSRSRMADCAARLRLPGCVGRAFRSAIPGPRGPGACRQGFLPRGENAGRPTKRRSGRDVRPACRAWD